MTELKHEKTINKILSFFHEPWMDEATKQDVESYALGAMEETKESLNEKIEGGVKLGVSADYQAELVLKSLSRAFPKS